MLVSSLGSSLIPCLSWLFVGLGHRSWTLLRRRDYPRPCVAERSRPCALPSHLSDALFHSTPPRKIEVLDLSPNLASPGLISKTNEREVRVMAHFVLPFILRGSLMYTCIQAQRQYPRRMKIKDHIKIIVYSMLQYCIV